MEKLPNVENNWDDEVDCPEVIEPCCLILEKELAASIIIITYSSIALISSSIETCSVH